jgi:hypothetical protein
MHIAEILKSDGFHTATGMVFQPTATVTMHRAVSTTLRATTHAVRFTDLAIIRAGLDAFRLIACCRFAPRSRKEVVVASAPPPSGRKKKR